MTIIIDLFYIFSLTMQVRWNWIVIAVGMNNGNKTRRMALSFIMVIFSISIFNLNMLSNVTWVYSMDWSRHHRMHHRWVIVWCNNDRGYGGNRWLWGNNDRGNRRLDVVDRSRCHMVNWFFDMVDRSRHNRGRNHMMDRLFDMVHRGRYNMMNRLFYVVDRSRHNRGWCHVMNGLFYVVDRSRRHMMNRFFDMVDRSNMMIGWRMMLIRTSCDRNNSDRPHMAAHMDARSRVVTMMYRLFHNNVLITKHLRSE